MASDELVFDGKNLEELAINMRHAADVIRARTTVAAVEAAGLVATDVRHELAEHSKDLADTVRVDPAPGAAVLTAGSTQKPLAVLWEFGNRGAAKTRDYFKAPLFGDKTHWYKHKRYPFLRPALLTVRKEMTKIMEKAWEEAIRAAHLRSE